MSHAANNTKFTMSPTLAVIFEGEYAKVPFGPTATSIVAARTAGKAENSQALRENIETTKAKESD
jgi:hypothetical protein